MFLRCARVRCLFILISSLNKGKGKDKVMVERGQQRGRLPDSEFEIKEVSERLPHDGLNADPFGVFVEVTLSLAYTPHATPQHHTMLCTAGDV